MAETSEAPIWDVEQSRRKGCKRWSTYAPGVLDLGVAEMDVSLSPAVTAAVRDAARTEAFGYPVPDARSAVPDATARWMGRLGLDVGSEGVRVVPDVMRGIAVAIRRLTRPDTAVVIPTPTYTRFLEVAPLTGRRCVQVPLVTGPHGPELDLEHIEGALAAGAGSVLLCNPVNPVGTIVRDEQLAALAEIVDRHGARVIVDEVHAPIRYGHPFTPYAALNEAAREHAITVTSATKAWNFPGLRTAMVVLTNVRDREVWDGLRHLETSGASPLGMVATAAALDHGEPWLRSVLKDLGAARDLVRDRMDAAGLSGLWRTPDATYFAWLDLRGLDPERPAAVLLERSGVAVGEGAGYGAAGGGFVRVNFATPPHVLGKALERIIGVLHLRDTRE
ncbi:MalY/PatB family protein [Actinomadura vinacea]|uniref:MalY/PatB family protein n=1 Tax=Actinomadura vinacea TaxID=115336 RepID=UPI0031CF3EE4